MKTFDKGTVIRTVLLYCAYQPNACHVWTNSAAD